MRTLPGLALAIVHGDAGALGKFVQAARDREARNASRVTGIDPTAEVTQVVEAAALRRPVAACALYGNAGDVACNAFGHAPLEAEAIVQ